MGEEEGLTFGDCREGFGLEGGGGLRRPDRVIVLDAAEETGPPWRCHLFCSHRKTQLTHAHAHTISVGARAMHAQPEHVVSGAPPVTRLYNYTAVPTPPHKAHVEHTLHH